MGFIIQDYVIIFMVIIILYLSYKKYIEKFTDPPTTTTSIQSIVAQKINDTFKADLSKIVDLGEKLNILNTINDNDDFADQNITVNDLNPDDITCENITIKGNIYIEDINNFDKKFNIYPRYMIMIWTQKVIPNGWVPCDGKPWYVKQSTGEIFSGTDFYNNYQQSQNSSNNQSFADYTSDQGFDLVHTPNLIDRFIIGATGETPSDKYQVNHVGGLADVTLNEDQIPAHYHILPIIVNMYEIKKGYQISSSSQCDFENILFPEMTGESKYSSRKNDYIGQGLEFEASDTPVQSIYTLKYKSLSHSVNIEDGSKTFKVYGGTNNYYGSGNPKDPYQYFPLYTDYARDMSLNPSGTNNAHSNMPPYYQLYYIMKL